MKILIVASTMVHINNFHRPYIERMRAEGNEVYIMANGEGADFDIDFKKRSLSFKNLHLSRKIRKILEKEKFDRVFLHTTLAAFVTRLAMKGMKKRPYVINTVHGYLFGEGSSPSRNFIYLSCERVLKNETDEIFVMNSEDYEIATKNKLCLGKVTHINGMGVNFRGECEYAPNVDAGVKRLVFAGEISKRKNQMLILKALTRVENATLTLVGDGACREALEGFVKKNSLEARVEIVGYQRDVYPYILNSDIYVSAAKIEGLPFNILEAMETGIPIIASDIKGHRDLLPEEALFESDNFEALAEKIKSTVPQKTSYETSKYGIDSVLDTNIALYLGERARVHS